MDMDSQFQSTYCAPMEQQSWIGIPGEYDCCSSFLESTYVVADTQQPLLQPQICHVDLSTPAHLMPGRFLDHLHGRGTFQTQQAIAPEQPRNIRGRPKKEKLVQEGPKRRPGRPKGAIDVVKRVSRGVKAAMDGDELSAHMSRKRKIRQKAKKKEALEDTSQPPIFGPVVSQAATEILDWGYESASLPSTASLEEPSDTDSDFELDLSPSFDFGHEVCIEVDPDFAADYGFAPRPASHSLTSIPEAPLDAGISEQQSTLSANLDEGVCSQPSFDSSYDMHKQVVQPQLPTGFTNHCQTNNYYGGQVTSSSHQDVITMPQQPIEEAGRWW